MVWYGSVIPHNMFFSCRLHAPEGTKGYSKDRFIDSAIKELLVQYTKFIYFV